MKNKLKNTLLKKTYIWAVFPLCGPASAFVGCWSLRGLSWLSSTPKRGVVGVVQPASNIKNEKEIEKYTIKKNIHMGCFPSLWACVGLRWLLGPSWAFVDKLYI